MSNSLTLFPDLLPPEPSDPHKSLLQETTNTEHVNEDVVIRARRYEQDVKRSKRINENIEFRRAVGELPSGDAARSSSSIAPWRVTSRKIFFDLEGSEKPEIENPVVMAPNVSQPIQPKEPTSNCPICWNAISEPTATKCGHVFCKNCITEAFAAQGKCPTCRRKLTKTAMFRVYLP